MINEKEPIKVLYATHEPNLTGASQSLIDILTNLDRSRIEPLVLVRKSGPLVDVLDQLGIRWIQIPYTLTIESAGRVRIAWLQRLINAIALIGITRVIRRERVKLVHSNSLLVDVAARAARMLDIPYVFHLREFIEEDHGGKFLDKESLRKVVKDASGTIAISQAVYDKFETWVNVKTCRVIPDGIDISRYYNEHTPLLRVRPIKMLLPGRFAPGKGQLDAIKAMALLRERGVSARLILIGGIGDRQYWEKCQNEIYRDGLEDLIECRSFAGDLRGLRASVDISLVCSHSEALGRVTIEGMLAGTLVIGANSGATPEIIESGINGVLYESAVPQSLCDEIEWAIEHPDEANRLAVEGRRMSREKYSVERYIMELEAVYHEIISGR